MFLDLSNFLWILKDYREPPSMRLSFDGTEVTRFAKHELDYHLGIMTHEDRFVWTDTLGEERTAHKTHRMARHVLRDCLLPRGPGLLGDTHVQ